MTAETRLLRMLIPCRRKANTVSSTLRPLTQFWIYNDFDIVDLSNYDYIAFWFYVNCIDLTSLELKIYNDNNNTWLSYDFLPLITEANKWHRILLHKSEFTVHYSGDPPEEVSFDWSALEEFFFEFTRADSQEMVFCFDDLGAYE